MQPPPLSAVDPAWDAHPADTWADAAVAAMRLGGVEELFFVSGSELTFYQEAIAKARVRGWPAPRLVTMVHEGVALNAALGAAMVSGRPAATAAHVDVGTLNYGAAIHTAWRGNAPLLITSGAGPRAYPGSMPGSRESGVQWVQAGDYDGGLFDPPPDFAKLAEAANGYGGTVADPEALTAALQRGLAEARKGVPAVVAVLLPTLVEEMGLAGS